MQWKVLFLVEIPSSNLGTVFGPSPLVQEVLSWQLQMKLWTPIWTSSSSQSWKAVYLITRVSRLPSLALWDNYNVAEPELWGQLKVVIRGSRKTITFWVKILPEKRKKCFPVTVSECSRTSRLSLRLTARQISASQRSASARLTNRKANCINISPASLCFSVFHHLVILKHRYEDCDKSSGDAECFQRLES